MSNRHLPLKNKLEEREIQPSENAWARLEGLLDAEIPEKKSRNFLPWAIAATFLLLFGIAFFVFNQNPTQPTLTKIPAQTDSEPQNEGNLIPNKTENSTILLDENQEKSESQIERFVHSNTKKNTEKLSPVSENISETSLIVHEQVPKPEMEVTVLETEKTPIAESLSSDEMLVNSLRKKRLQQDSKIAVNSEKLLNTVEDEIYEKRKPDLLERLTDKLKSVQMVLSERNEQK
ncbi:MAG: hypothetical protein Q4G27_04290 [Flavobacteriaceae bacterium]|nr:hypothetical protein [Flavobacteriaceae bacterium]